MALPAAVQKQVDQANEIHEQMRKAAAPVEEVEAVEAEPIEEVKQEAPKEEVEPVEKPKVEDWEHKYRVLQGKYNSEVPRLSQQVSQLQQQLSELAEQVKTPAEPVAASQLVSQQEIDEYGPDLIDLVGRRAQEVYEPLIKDLKSEIAGLKQQLGGVTETVVRSARDKMIDALAAKVPNYTEINTSQDFMTWLDAVDPYSGEQRGAMLRQAFEANHAERVIAFFTGFLSEHAAIAGQGQQDSAPRRTPKVDLSEHVAPGTPAKRAPTTGAQSEKRIWKQTEIAQFYADVNRGVFKNKEDDRMRIERDIVAAAREGRVRS